MLFNRKIKNIMTAVCIFGLLFSVTIGKTAYRDYREQKMYHHVEMGKSHVVKKDVIHTKVDKKSFDYRKETKVQIDKFKKEQAYTPVNPLLIHDPYGIDSSQLYFYVKTEIPTKMSYTVEAETDQDRKYRTTETEQKKKYSYQHEYEIEGLEKNTKNKISIRFIDKDHHVIAKKYFYINIA